MWSKFYKNAKNFASTFFYKKTQEPESFEMTSPLLWANNELKVEEITIVEDHISILSNSEESQLTENEKFVHLDTTDHEDLPIYDQLVEAAEDKLPGYNQLVSPLELAKLATNKAYKVDKVGASFELDPLLVGANWELLHHSGQYLETNNSHYRSVVYVNNATKQVHISTAGISFSNTDDLIDVYRVGLGATPYKFDCAKKFIDLTIKELIKRDIDLKDFEITSSGHSMGAIVSDLTATELLSRGFDVKETITFDSPGSLNTIKNALDSKVFSGSEKVTIDMVSDISKVYNGNLNSINICGPQLGKTFVVVNTDKKVDYENDLFKDLSYITQAVDTLATYLTVAAIKLTTIDGVPLLAKFIGAKGCYAAYQGITDHHKMENFENISDSNKTKIVPVDNYVIGDGFKLAVEVPHAKFADMKPSDNKEVFVFTELQTSSMVVDGYTAIDGKFTGLSGLVSEEADIF